MLLTGVITLGNVVTQKIISVTDWRDIAVDKRKPVIK